MPFNLLHWKGLLFRLDKVKRGINLKMLNAPFRVSFVVLCSRIGTRSTSKHPPGKQGLSGSVIDAREKKESQFSLEDLRVSVFIWGSGHIQ